MVPRNKHVAWAFFHFLHLLTEWREALEDKDRATMWKEPGFLQNCLLIMNPFTGCLHEPQNYCTKPSKFEDLVKLLALL